MFCDCCDTVARLYLEKSWCRDTKSASLLFPLKTVNFIHVAQHYVLSTVLRQTNNTHHFVFRSVVHHVFHGKHVKLIEDFQARSCLWDVDPWIIKIEIKGEMSCTNLQSNMRYRIRRCGKNHNLNHSSEEKIKNWKNQSAICFDYQPYKIVQRA